ncbi:MAG: rhodanese-like domain-containing protein [Elainella sp.]
MTKIEDALVTAKDKLPDVTPTPPGFNPEATAADLKSRLQWGEPGLTILDVRDHDIFNECRIQGAMNMPMSRLLSMVNSIPKQRDIYVYANTDEETAEAVNLLRQAGFERVSHLKGGLQDWVNIDGKIEGVVITPGNDAYNVMARLDAFSKEKAKEKSLR